MAGFGEKTMESALDAAAKGDSFICGERSISYGGGEPYEVGSMKPTQETDGGNLKSVKRKGGKSSDMSGV